MRLTELIKPAEAVYEKVAIESREWVEHNYIGLSLDFEPHLEIVATSALLAEYPKALVIEITEAVNKRIGEIMEKYAEEIVLSERVERIRKAHPRFNIEVESIAELKKHPLFLKYLKELIIKPKKFAE